MNEPGRAEWLAWRRAGIGGSDVAGILGLSPWATPVSVYASKVTTEPDGEVSDAMEFGKRAEPMLAEWFHDRTGLYVLGEQTWCTHATVPYRRCTVDGFVAESEHSSLDDVLGVAEWKTTSDTADEWAEHVPDHYATQAAWSMAVCDLPRVWFGVLHLAFGRPTFRVYTFDRDLDDERYVLDVVDRYWHDYVEARVPPPTDGEDVTTKALNRLWPDTSDAVLGADERLRFAVDQVQWFRAERDSAQAGLDAAENELRALMGEHEVVADIALDGKAHNLATWKWQTSRRVDTTRLRAAWPDLAREFETETSTRVLRVSKRR
jgi:putative phage-type endonuclease